jgi:hypothetical protein
MSSRLNFLPSSALFLFLGHVALAFSPVATVTSADPFTLDGRAVSASATTPVPLNFGNEVATSTAPALLFFADGSSVKLAAGSRAKLIGSELQPKIVLLAGSLDYKVVLGSKLSVTNLDLERKAKVTGLAVKPVTKPLAAQQRYDVTH